MFVNSVVKTRYLKLWLLTIYFLIILMIIVGGLTRLTDSGLSITKWELFTGILPPFTSDQWNIYFLEYKKIPEFIYLNSNITLNEFKVIFYWEYFHRLLARVVGLVSLIPLLYFVYKYRHETKNLSKYFVIFILVCAQGLLGWYMVESGLVERVDVSHFRLAAHLSLAFIILSLTFWYFLETIDIKSFEYKISNIFLTILLLVIFLQIILGAFLAGLDGGLIFNTWPDMNGKLLPDDSKFTDFFTYDALNTPSIIQFVHRKIAYILTFLVLYLNLIYIKKKLPATPLIVFDLTILFQIFLGVITLLSGAKILYASLHQIGSIFVVSSFLFIFYKNYKTNLQPLN